MSVKNRIIEQIKVFTWNVTKGLSIHFNYWKCRHDRNALQNVMNSEETILFIKRHKCSVARYGDGEFQMVEHFLSNMDDSSFSVDSFQNYDKTLAKKLYDTLTCPPPGMLVCIPYPMIDSSVYKGYNRTFFEREWLGRRKWLQGIIANRQKWGDSAFTRFYLNRTDINDYPHYISLFKGLWDGQDIILIEGEYSRLGVGNDLFNNVGSIKRVLCPAKNAFARYDQILSTALSFDKDSLFLLALGHTATVLANDMCQQGYRAIDLGHIDIEYEWYKMKAKKKMPVINKYVNEVSGGRIADNESFEDQEYQSQIIARIE